MVAGPDYESVVDEESGQPSQVGDDEWDQPEASAPRERVPIELRPKEAVPNGRHQPKLRNEVFECRLWLMEISSNSGKRCAATRKVLL